MMPIRTCSLIATTIYPNHSAGHRSGLWRGETSAFLAARFQFPLHILQRELPRLVCPLLTSPMRSGPIARPSANFRRTRLPRAHRRPPGVLPATFDARLSDICDWNSRWIEDFVVCCCRLVSPNPA